MTPKRSVILSAAWSFAALLATSHAVETATRPTAAADSDAELQAAINPPPISLSVKDAGLAELASALSTATGAPISAYTRNEWAGPKSDRYSLEADKLPFWDVAVALNNQHPLYFWCNRARPFGLTLFSRGAETRTGAKAAGFFVYAEKLVRSRETRFQTDGPPLKPEEWALTYNIRPDPRIVVLAAQPLFTRQAVDDAGNLLFQADKPVTDWQRPDLFAWSATLPLAVPQKPGKKIASLTGEATFIVAVGTKKVEVPDIQKMAGPLQLPCDTITITPGRVTDGSGPPWTTFQLFITSKPSRDIPAEFHGRVGVRLIDAAGTELLSERTDENSSTGEFETALTFFKGKPLAFQPPIKMLVTAPARLAKVTIPFELKAIPMPGAAK